MTMSSSKMSKLAAHLFWLHNLIDLSIKSNLEEDLLDKMIKLRNMKLCGCVTPFAKVKSDSRDR